MGCDIHPFIDYEINDYITSFGALRGTRNYVLFGLLTDGEVRYPRGAGHAPSPKGLPDKLGYASSDQALLYVSDEK